MLTPAATDIPTMPCAVASCCWEITSGTIDATPANGTENRPDFRSRTVLVLRREPVGPDAPGPPFRRQGSMSTNQPCAIPT